MRTIFAHSLAAGLLGAGAVGCTDEPAPSGPDVTSHILFRELPAALPHATDLLFVVGDTASYDVSSLPALVDSTVADIAHGFPNVRIVTTSSPDVLELKTDIFGEHTQSFTGSLRDALATRLAPGNTQLLARMQSSADFTRDEAYLAVFIVTAADDTSPDASYADMLKATKVDPANVVISGIYHRPAPRLDAFLDAFPNRSSFTSIDSADFTHAFDLVHQLQRWSFADPCFEAPLDLDPNTPGNQVDCDITAWDGTTEVSRIPLCGDADPTSGSCWEIVADPQNCLSPPGIRFGLRGEWSWFHPMIRLQCATL